MCRTCKGVVCDIAEGRATASPSVGTPAQNYLKDNFQHQDYHSLSGRVAPPIRHNPSRTPIPGISLPNSGFFQPQVCEPCDARKHHYAPYHLRGVAAYAVDGGDFTAAGSQPEAGGGNYVVDYMCRDR